MTNVRLEGDAPALKSKMRTVRDLRFTSRHSETLSLRNRTSSVGTAAAHALAAMHHPIKRIRS